MDGRFPVYQPTITQTTLDTEHLAAPNRLLVAVCAAQTGHVKRFSQPLQVKMGFAV